MEKYSTLRIIKSMKSKLQWSITSHWSQWPSSKKKKSCTKNKYCRGCTEKGILLQSQWECKLWSHCGKSMEVPWNTKHRGIISFNPTPKLRCGESHHSKWHVPLDFWSSTINSSQAMEPTKTSIDRKMKTTWSINTVRYYLALKQEK